MYTPYLIICFGAHLSIIVRFSKHSVIILATRIEQILRSCCSSLSFKINCAADGASVKRTQDKIRFYRLLSQTDVFCLWLLSSTIYQNYVADGSFKKTDTSWYETMTLSSVQLSHFDLMSSVAWKELMMFNQKLSANISHLQSGSKNFFSQTSVVVT